MLLETRRSEIDDLNLRVAWVSEQDVLRLQVAVNDALLFEQQKGRQKLLRKASNQAKREATERVHLDKLIQVHT